MMKNFGNYKQKDLFRNKSNNVQVFFDGKLIPEELLNRIADDSLYIESFMSTYCPQELQAKAVFDYFSNCEHWQERSRSELMNRGNELNRTKIFASFNTEVDPETGIPLQIARYSYTGSQWRNLLNYRTFDRLNPMAQILNSLSFKASSAKSSADLGFAEEEKGEQQAVVLEIAKPANINHIIVTAYETTTDGIGLHSDKEKDIAKDSYILSFSLGDTMEFKLFEKSSNKTEILLQKSGSLLVLGPKTNRDYMHGIVPVEEEEVAKELRGTTPFCGRISIIGRHISTVFPAEKIIAECNKSTEDAVNRACGKRLKQVKEDIRRKSKSSGVTVQNLQKTYAEEIKRAEEERDEIKEENFGPLVDLLKKKPSTYAEVKMASDMYDDHIKKFPESHKRSKKRAKTNSPE